MQEEKKTNMKITVLVLAIVVIGSAVFFLMKNKAEEPAPAAGSPEAQVSETTPEGPTDVSGNVEQEVPVQAEPAKLSDDIQSQINAITAKVDSGELTLEEAQKQVNKLLNIE